MVNVNVITLKYYDVYKIKLYFKKIININNLKIIKNLKKVYIIALKTTHKWPLIKAFKFSHAVVMHTHILHILEIKVNFGSYDGAITLLFLLNASI